jgi:hypothetical protein
VVIFGLSADNEVVLRKVEEQSKKEPKVALGVEAGDISILSNYTFVENQGILGAWGLDRASQIRNVRTYEESSGERQPHILNFWVDKEGEKRELFKSGYPLRMEENVPKESSWGDLFCQPGGVHAKYWEAWHNNIRKLVDWGSLTLDVSYETAFRDDLNLFDPVRFFEASPENHTTVSTELSGQYLITRILWKIKGKKIYTGLRLAGKSRLLK